MKQYINPEKCPTYKKKSQKHQNLINDALFILDVFGVPMNRTGRMLEKTAISFLACGNIKSKSDFKKISDLHSGFALGTKEIIDFVNANFDEEISRGSYDYIKRHALDYLLPAGIVLQSSPNSATNDSTRGYSINPEYAKLVRRFDRKNWSASMKTELINVVPLSQKLKRERKLAKIDVILPKGKKIKFTVGKHNELQKAVIEHFLPNYGYGATILYVGDTTDKYLHLDKKALNKLNFFELSHQELPDIIAYSASKNWLYLIECVYTSGEISELKLMKFQELTKKCSAEIIYVTAFLEKSKFKKCASNIAWETEVWIADAPSHLIHFNGDKFLGPYNAK